MSPRTAAVRFVLASASPARSATLRAAGIEPEVIAADVDESAVTAADTATLVAELARRKARTVADRLAGSGARVAGSQARVAGPTLVLGCDSLLELAGRPCGKPGSAAAAAERWRVMRGRSGVLRTGHCLIEVGSGRELVEVASATVEFADLSDAEIEAYVATGEPLGVAGGFTIDGLGGAFVESISGDPHTVVGLSLPLLRRMLAGLGYGWFDVARAS